MDHVLQKHQQRLNDIGYDAGPADGDWGGRTMGAVAEFQQLNGLPVDAQLGPKSLGPKTIAVLYSTDAKSPTTGWKAPTAVMAPSPVAIARWPLERDVAKVFGAAGGPQCTAGKVKLPIPFALAWDLDQQIKTFNCHELVAAPITRVFERAVEAYGEAKFQELRLHLFGGCYNYRPMRGGSSLSMHSWGIAVDLDPTHNQLKWGRDRAAFARPEYSQFWQAVEAEGLVSLGRTANYDYMHFQAARR
jgi:hypothetical protein